MRMRASPLSEVVWLVKESVAFVAVADSDALLRVAVRLDARAWERDGEAVTLIHARVV